MNNSNDLTEFQVRQPYYCQELDKSVPSNDVETTFFPEFPMSHAQNGFKHSVSDSFRTNLSGQSSSFVEPCSGLH